MLGYLGKVGSNLHVAVGHQRLSVFNTVHNELSVIQVSSYLCDSVWHGACYRLPLPVLCFLPLNLVDNGININQVKQYHSSKGYIQFTRIYLTNSKVRHQHEVHTTHGDAKKKKFLETNIMITDKMYLYAKHVIHEMILSPGYQRESQKNLEAFKLND